MVIAVLLTGIQYAHAECIDKTTQDDKNYNHLDLNIENGNAVVFTVRAANDAHLGFFSGSKANTEVYEIVISGWDNTESAVRKCKACKNQVSVASRGLLSNSEARPFWASAVDGLVIFGAGNTVGENVLMKWQDPEHHQVESVGVMTGWGSGGVWKVCNVETTSTTTTTTTLCEGCTSTTTTTETTTTTTTFFEDTHSALDTPTFVRWGSENCPQGTTRLYDGIAAGSHYNEGGGGATTICLHSKPEHPAFSRSDSYDAYIYGTEYQNTGALDHNHDQDAACAMCAVNDPGDVYVQWGRSDSCSSGHTTLYSGLVMANSYNQQSSSFVCVDLERAKHFGSTGSDSNGNLWYTTETKQGSIDESLYPHNREVGCSVCLAPKPTYVRWGSNSCPSGSELLFKGIAAGNAYNHGGSGTNTLCLHTSPQYPKGFSDGDQDGALLYGTEYQNTGTLDGSAKENKDAACAMCMSSTAGDVYVQWGRSNSCSNEHTTLYTGLVMADYYKYHEEDTLCVDPERASHAGGSSGNENGHLWYTSESEKGAIDESIYPDDREVGCSVCLAPKPVFPRWGSNSCPSGSTQLYKGIAAGSHYDHGGSVTTICLHPNPQYPTGYSDGNRNGNLIYGVEYQTYNAGGTSKHDTDAACSMCMSDKGGDIYVQWGRSKTCSNEHTTLYSGLAMAERYTHHKSDYVCVDPEHANHASSSRSDNNGKLWYTVEIKAGSMDESLYPHDTELGCSVCQSIPRWTPSMECGDNGSAQQVLDHFTSSLQKTLNTLVPRVNDLMLLPLQEIEEKIVAEVVGTQYQESWNDGCKGFKLFGACIGCTLSGTVYGKLTSLTGISNLKLKEFRNIRILEVTDAIANGTTASYKVSLGAGFVHEEIKAAADVWGDARCGISASVKTFTPSVEVDVRVYAEIVGTVTLDLDDLCVNFEFESITFPRFAFSIEDVNIPTVRISLPIIGTISLPSSFTNDVEDILENKIGDEIIMPTLKKDLVPKAEEEITTILKDKTDLPCIDLNNSDIYALFPKGGGDRRSRRSLKPMTIHDARETKTDTRRASCNEDEEQVTIAALTTKIAAYLNANEAVTTVNSALQILPSDMDKSALTAKAELGLDFGCMFGNCVMEAEAYVGLTGLSGFDNLFVNGDVKVVATPGEEPCSGMYQLNITIPVETQKLTVAAAANVSDVGLCGYGIPGNPTVAANFGTSGKAFLSLEIEAVAEFSKYDSCANVGVEAVWLKRFGATIGEVSGDVAIDFEGFGTTSLPIPPFEDVTVGLVDKMGWKYEEILTNLLTNGDGAMAKFDQFLALACPTTTTTTTTSVTTTTLRMCTAGEYRDASSNTCTQCPQQTFRSEQSHTLLECSPITECDSHEFVVKKGMATHNTVCKTSEPCADGEWESTPPVGGLHERECTPLTTCLPGEYTTKDGTHSTDRSEGAGSDAGSSDTSASASTEPESDENDDANGISKDTLIYIIVGAVVVIAVVIGVAVVVLKKSSNESAGLHAISSFANPMYDGIINTSNPDPQSSSGTNYMDVPASGAGYLDDNAAGYMDIPASSSSGGYMDVNASSDYLDVNPTAPSKSAHRQSLTFEQDAHDGNISSDASAEIEV
eukprot:gene6823-3689_t